MQSLSLLSWNVRGLNSEIKRALVFKYILKRKPHIIFLQESHLVGSKTLALHRAGFSRAFHSTYSSYARGVSVLIAKSLLYTIKTVKLDPTGRYVALVLIIDNQVYTFVAIYIPPPFTIKVWEANGGVEAGGRSSYSSW